MSAELLVSFERPTYTVNENDPVAQVCFLTNSGHPDRDVTVMVQAQMLSDGSPECTDFPAADGMIISWPYSQQQRDHYFFVFQQTVIFVQIDHIHKLLLLPQWEISSV